LWIELADIIQQLFDPASTFDPQQSVESWLDKFPTVAKS
jgi:hypothetical protein